MERFASKHPILQQAARWVHTAAVRDLPPGGPPYVIGADELPPEQVANVPHNCDAYTSPTLASELRNTLVRSGAWHGPSFCTVVFLGRMPTNDLMHVAGIAIHEFGHFIEFAAFRQATPEQRETGLIFGTTWAGDGKPWKWHGPAWIRAGLHLAYRAASAGWNGTPEAISIAGELYGLSDANDYRLALGSEPHDCERERIVDVLKRPLPEEFLSLWIDDVQRGLRAEQLAAKIEANHRQTIERMSA